MSEELTYREKIDAAAIAGEMAAQRLHDLILDRMEELHEQGETQADIARTLGASPQQVGNWLVEPRNMTIRSIGRLLHAMRAHLLFDLDRFEHMSGGNALAKPVALTVISTPTLAPPASIKAPTVIHGGNVVNALTSISE